MLEPWSLHQKRFKKKIALQLGYRRMLNEAALLHCGNADERRQLAALQLKPPSATIPNGIFLQEVEPLPEKGAYRRQHPQLADARLILFLSRLHYQKGLDVLIEAFAKIAGEIPDAALVIAGPDDGAQADAVSQLARLGISHRVHLIGPVYGADKWAILRDCDCFCLPSRHEGFSMAVLEAMACEAPVVLTPGCHFPEAAEAGAAIETPLDAASIAAAISSILRDPASATHIGRKARELIASRYTWSQLASELVDEYRKILSP
jgi:glycosyltransferase involved in cell wall biosynthesis